MLRNSFSMDTLKEIVCSNAYATLAHELHFGEYGVAIIDIVLNDIFALALELRNNHPWTRIAHVKRLVPAIDNKPA
jgi:hypothetical protein